MKLCPVCILGSLVWTLATLTMTPERLDGADSLFVPDDPLRGRLVFEQKGCFKCHAVLGKGAFIGPDLGKKHFAGDFLELGRVMWNHSPDMTQRMQEMLQPRPTFSVPEIRDLFVFLFYLAYLGEPGSPEAGAKIFTDKGCLRCHGERADRGRSPPLSDVATHASPVALAQAMWNHGPAMDQEIRARGMPRPRFEGEEIAHVASYLKSLYSGTRNPEQLMKPGNPRSGENVFAKKGCIECHSVGENGNTDGPNLARTFIRLSVTEIAGIMWNHGPDMWEGLGSEVERVKFEGDEMADVIAYLYFAGLHVETGDRENGARIFTAKGCSICHDNSAGEEFAVDLSETRTFNSPLEMVRMMWNHAPQMEELMQERNIPWPRFHEGEMADLYSYLSRVGVEE